MYYKFIIYICTHAYAWILPSSFFFLFLFCEPSYVMRRSKIEEGSNDDDYDDDDDDEDNHDDHNYVNDEKWHAMPS